MILERFLWHFLFRLVTLHNRTGTTRSSSIRKSFNSILTRCKKKATLASSTFKTKAFKLYCTGNLNLRSDLSAIIHLLLLLLTKRFSYMDALSKYKQHRYCHGCLVFGYNCVLQNVLYSVHDLFYKSQRS